MSGRESMTFDGVEYVPGRKYRVTAEGVTLSGRIPMPGGWRGWSAPLPVGTVVTCQGYGPGWGSDPGYGVEFLSDASREAGASAGELRPSAGSVFDYRPAPGILEPLPDAEQDEERRVAAERAAESARWDAMRDSMLGKG